MHLHAPSRASFKPLFGFVSLLFYADPTWLDRILVVTGFFAAIAAGVPFPLVGIIFGQLVHDINDATCDSDTAPAESQSSINAKVLLLVYIAIGSFVLLYTHIFVYTHAHPCARSMVTRVAVSKRQLPPLGLQYLWRR